MHGQGYGHRASMEDSLTGFVVMAAVGIAIALLVLTFKGLKAGCAYIQARRDV